jgi:hypothetical protein
MDAMKAAGNADDAPKYLKDMVGHLKQINKLTKDNLSDCTAAATAVEKYVKDNEGNLKALKTQADEAQKTMKPEDQAKMAGAAMALIGPVMQDMMKVQMEFAQKCPKESKDLNKSLSALKMK